MKEAILLTYMGAPSTLSEIRPFLYRLFSDRDLINFGVPPFLQKPLAWLISLFRAPKVKPQYEAIGGGSPLVKYTYEQAELIERKTGIKTFVGMLYSSPLLEEVSEEIVNYSPDLLYVVTLYPQFSFGTAGACLRDVEKLLGGRVPYKAVKSWCRNPYYIRWIQESIERELAGLSPKDTAILFSAHSLPEYFIEEKKDLYVDEIKDTVKLVMEAFSEFPFRISYQSKVGPIKWLEPSTEEELHRLREEGFKNVVVFPVSFVSEHIETLYELDVEYAKVAKELSLNYKRVRLNHCSPLLTEAIISEIWKIRGKEEL
ncbi:ferrochelatase [Phorcysia thermohydrogeniphila]|uniref:Ferrochelatase n=1 Tax=Phorcysia thermohydrogeniphila TaxID=936138 RepID=A0A4R1GH11_9BACT|nr:ferrochelatase [Phorcysia thermohydrogeniphila]TCK06281.1 ferrochelatase [Phorcysia thermohydrogeniphila]